MSGIQGDIGMGLAPAGKTATDPSGNLTKATAAAGAATVTDCYCGDPTQTATNGVLEAEPAGPHDAPRSPRYWA